MNKTFKVLFLFLFLTIFIVGCKRTDFGDWQNLVESEVKDLEVFEVSIKVVDLLGHAVSNANVRLYNQDHSIFFPINTNPEEFEGKQCNKVFFDDNFYAKTNSNGIARVKITKGDYLLQAFKVENKYALYLEKDILLDRSQEVELRAEREQKLNVFVDGVQLENFEAWITHKNQKPAFPPFYLDWVEADLMIQTSPSTQASIIITKRPSENLAGYVISEDLTRTTENVMIVRSSMNLAELSFESFNGNNQPESIGSVYLNFVDFYLNNFGTDFDLNNGNKILLDPQTIRVWFRLDKGGQSFSLYKKGGHVVELKRGGKKKFNFGGPFDLKLEIASFNPKIHASRNYVWFVVKDYYGNYVNDYRTINPSAPKVTIKENNAVVFDSPLENNYPDIHMDVRNNVYFDNFENYVVSFSEDFHEFGSISLVEEPMQNLRMPLLTFESENLEFILPKELEFLKDDWTSNFQHFYDKMAQLYEVRTQEKVPVRVVVDGADKAWAPIIWPLVAFEHDTRNYQAWFMIVHEIGHPFTGNKPISCKNDCPYNEESKASYSGISAAIGVNPIVGESIKAKYPLSFKHLTDQSVCFDRIEVIQTLMLYLDEKYPSSKPSVQLIKNWAEYQEVYDELIRLGYNHDEAYCALYSMVVNKNLGPVFEKFGLVRKQRVTNALKDISS
ncbi:hypothetical protein HN592_00165 [Candidatus Woesearchaeota archaeon]|jgi:hypothetical protein|nr:hypothetical protein [Candidatus Woesearchaeota archaeon]MBT4368690.1 hypothetical protein [Candidatus Woesearchaeota archaeon]MBT4711979.1 hypothetical protein [Candidatus Woesearchaeota archaeon]MBT6638874.1 hypothetical protein [Candidatus Woesearchaeota archaeon]MBT7134518.1 hypothetical protein [Candidatus Woesearchaeota archaeon]